MKIKVKVHGTLMKYLPNYDHGTGVDLELPGNSIVDEVIKKLGIPEDKVSLVSVNGRLAKAEDRLKQNDVVKVFQHIFGG
jgi:sulfur carrier protein ThiS